MMNNFLLIILLLTVAVTGKYRMDPELERCAVTSNYIVSNQVFDNETMYLNFEVFPTFSKEIYEDPMWSVKVIDYKSNGLSIEAQHYPVIFFSFINSKKVKVQEGELSIPFGFWEFYTGEFVGGEDLFKNIHAYSVGNNQINNIEIKYMLTYSDGSYDPGCYVLRATHKNQLTHTSELSYH